MGLTVDVDVPSGYANPAKNLSANGKLKNHDISKNIAKKK